MSIVYLAGGFSDWRNNVISPKHKLIDPSLKEKDKVYAVEDYIEWDKDAIGVSDIVFAYMERTNPSGFGLACEIAYAYALEKTVILILEKNHEKHSDKSLAFLTGFADFVYDSFNDGLNKLNELD